MEFAQFVEWVFYGVISGCALYITNLISELRTSIEQLNIKIAVIIERQENHASQFEKIERHFEKIEQRLKTKKGG